jgi:acyl-CoA-dependent ceramide synthase
VNDGADERIRQSVTLYVLRRLALRLGIKGAKIMRFTEREPVISMTDGAEGYAIFYFTLTSICGIVSRQSGPTNAQYVMRGLPIWCMFT